MNLGVFIALEIDPCTYWKISMASEKGKMGIYFSFGNRHSYGLQIINQNRRQNMHIIKCI